MWERFSYYGMRAIFILFMTKILLMKDADASQIYGSYTGLVYLTPLLGGYLCDKFLGNRRSIIIGGLLMAIGQFCMFFSASLGVNGGVTVMWMGLTAIIIGNGFFKPAGYEVAFSKEGFQTKKIQVTASVNGWYIGNIIFGGLLGLLIIDPATGAMYTLSPKDVNAMKINVPTKQCLDLYNKRITPYFDMIKSLQKQIKLLSEARDRLLPKLMSGELEV